MTKSDVRTLILNDLMLAGHTGAQLDALADTMTLLVEALDARGAQGV